MNARGPSWGRPFSPLGCWQHVGAKAVQQSLRQLFGRWGMPQRLRVDNGFPWGATGGLPTELALWLIGLGVGVIWNPPRRPQSNGVIERFQGVGKNWGEPHTCADADELQRRMDDLDRLQREEYPYCQEASRIDVYPELKHSGRRYEEAKEQEQWSLTRVLEYLASNTLTRKVDAGGRVSIYDRSRWVGKKHAGKTVYITLDPEDKYWVIEEDKGVVLQRKPAGELTAEAIRTLSVARPRGSESGQT